MKIQFTEKAWEQYSYWVETDQKTVLRILRLITDITRGGRLGKAEILKGSFHGSMSRRIDEKHRLIYRITDDVLIILLCYGHYND
ncbi:MAG: Txe/YoeB family addiction module toxin [Symbiobacteriaceae bacterium]|nr:Txe/YoeB family addiction module toxin [Symbiobacteriaceae bacterium]